MKTIKYIILSAFSIAITCLTWGCTDDNYDAPNETLTGTIVDETTGKPFISEQPDGYRIKMEEISWSDTPQPEYFWGRADGTFTNTKVFTGKYLITPVEGAFFPIESKTVDIKGTIKVDFTVTPYLSINNVSIKKENSNSIEVSYTLSRSKVGDKIQDARVFVSTNPNVGTKIFTADLSPLKDLLDTEDKDVLADSYKEVISGFTSGKSYYIRIGARTKNASGRYNFTEIVKIDM